MVVKLSLAQVLLWKSLKRPTQGQPIDFCPLVRKNESLELLIFTCLAVSQGVNLMI